MRSKRPTLIAIALFSLAIARPGVAQVPTSAPKSVVRPKELLNQVVTGMPRDSAQEIRVITAIFHPGDKTVFHTHRRPVTVYVLEGTFTLEMEDRKPAVVHAGEAFVEPPNVRMTGHNHSATEKTRVVVFYVSEPGAPFLDLIS
ncbi:MAG TPA: cupin domain-containing protein [Gemmatimonadaceae bacterium]|nr:cupin domain-containing protein [Gemmatimonadaceae bacterium]